MSKRTILERILRRIEEIMSELESVMEEEQEAYDNIPERLQYSERGKQMQDNINILSSEIDALQTQRFICFKLLTGL